jgi:hypothetical protein
MDRPFAGGEIAADDDGANRQNDNSALRVGFSMFDLGNRDAGNRMGRSPLNPSGGCA